MKKKFKLHTFGCRTNRYESQAIIDQMQEIGYELVDIDPDIHIVNTCFVTKKAGKTALIRVKQLLASSFNSKIFITGCASSLFEDMNSSRIVVVSNSEKEKLISYIWTYEKIKIPSFRIKNFIGQTRAFIKIQDGCNNFCSYCIVPFVRGRSYSRPIKDIYEEVKEIVESGFKEIVLTGINIGDYRDNEKRLSDLIIEFYKIKGLERIRLSSIDPYQIDEKLKRVILQSKKVCPSLHISLQSGSDRILKKMNRKYSTEDFLEIVSYFKSKNENFTFTTDIIAGFPSETEDDFKKSLKIIEEVKFAKVHIFPYSKRKGTLADKFSEVIPEKIINKRKKILLNFAEKTALDLRKKYIGKKMKVLLENKSNDNFFSGHSDNFLNIKVKNDNFCKNDLIEVEIIKNTPDGLIGKKTWE